MWGGGAGAEWSMALRENKRNPKDPRFTLGLGNILMLFQAWYLLGNYFSLVCSTKYWELT